MKKNDQTQPVKTKTTANKTAGLRAVESNKTGSAKKPGQQSGRKVPVVKDIDESSPDRR